MVSINITGVILLGGFSLRMGSPKGAMVLPDGKTTARKIIQTLKEVCKRVIGVGDPQGWTPPARLRVLSDVQPCEGPLVGIYTALTSGLSRYYVICSCDQPLIQVRHITNLIEFEGGDPPVIVYQDISNGQVYPFPGFYSSLAKSHLEIYLSSGERSVLKWLNSIPVITLPIPKEETLYLRGFNTDEEWNELLRHYYYAE